MEESDRRAGLRAKSSSKLNTSMRSRNGGEWRRMEGNGGDWRRMEGKGGEWRGTVDALAKG